MRGAAKTMLEKYLAVRNWLDEKEEGIETIEWIGLAAVIIALMVALAMFMRIAGLSIGNTLMQKINELIRRI